MADDEQNVSIKASVVETTEETFKPGMGIPITEELEAEGLPSETITEQQAIQIFETLEPLEQEGSTFYPQDWLEFYKTIIPPYVSTYTGLPEYEAPQKELVVNCETTGALPWESRIIVIGVLDPNKLEPEILQFRQETEEATIAEFVDWFNSQSYDTLVSFNVAFDYRFLYALMQRYRMLCPKWPLLELYDLMIQQQKVKQSFVPGYNKEGKLEEWSTYLFGTQPYAAQEQVYKWLQEGNYEEIENFNADKLTKTYMLFTLGRVVAGTLAGAKITAEQAASVVQSTVGARYPSAETADNEIAIKCPKCYADQYMNKNLKVVNCFVCGEPIANPML